MDTAFSALRRFLEGREVRLLMLDYDGTLAPLREEREKAFPYPGVRSLLRGLIGQGRTRIVVVSGRAVNDLVPLLGIDPPPEIWGSHGLERRRTNGDCQTGSLSADWVRGLADADAWVARQGLESRAETKPGSVALHWRGMTPKERRKAEQAARDGWTPIARKFNLKIHPFDGGVEIRIPGANKGEVVRTLLEESSPGVAAAYLGDDRTDEDAFRVMEGKGLAVLVRPEPRESLAAVWIRPPEQLRGFLKTWTAS
jgi:trehalose-phosphatase